MTSASNAAAVTFPQATGGSETETYFGIGTAPSGSGVLLYRKALASSVAISNNIQPIFNIGQLTVTDSGDISNSWILDILNLVFNNANAANIGDSTGLRGSSTAGSLYVSLHTADPGAGGNQTTNEAAYTSYARVAVARSSAGWTIA